MKRKIVLSLILVIAVIAVVVVPVISVYATVTTIDIGPGATDRTSSEIMAKATFIDISNPANATGILTSVELWFIGSGNASGVKVGTFYGSGTNYTYRAGATIGNVTKGSKQTVTGLNIAVSSGDFLGVYTSNSSDFIECSTTGGSGLYDLSGDHMTAEGAKTYSLAGSTYAISIYATGITVPTAPTNVSATDGTYTDKVVITWTKSTGATGYNVFQGTTLLATLGDVATYNDTTAGAPSITAGTATASDGTYTDYVNLSVSGQAGVNGASRTYKVTASDAAGNSSDSNTDTGYRGTTALTYQWQRSAADSDASYSDISGGTTNPYNDTGAPANGDGRYFKCIVSMSGATSNTTVADRGYRLIPTPTPTPTPSAPTVDTVALYQSDENTLINSGGSMDPLVEFAVKVTVTDANKLDDITQVKLTIFYDSVGNNPSAPGTSNTQTCAIITWASGSGWSIDPSAATTWVLVTGNCKTPTMSGTTGNWWVHFKPGKVATKSGAADNWDLYAKATDGASLTGDLYARDYEMNWYGEITVNTGSVNWGTVAVGSDFSANQQTGISVTYIANGAYNEQVKASSPWGTPPNQVTMNAAGTPGSGEFSLKADDTATLGSAVLVASADYTTFDTGSLTGESGNVESANTLWLKLGSEGIRDVACTGTIYYQISH